AVVCGEERVSYGELMVRAGGVARRLRAAGVGRETRVGLCVERSVELVVGMVGVLLAGGAYVPLDPRYPEERLRLLMEDSGAEVMLVGRGVKGRLPAGRARRVELAEAETRAEGE